MEPYLIIDVWETVLIKLILCLMSLTEKEISGLCL